MTLPKSDDNSRRNALLEKIADCCVSQGTYQLATKKYTQAGKKKKAMQALLKSGDTNKIIFFATKCRAKETYVMAANYLQNLDWRNQSDIMRNIVQFYTKGKALDSLSRFYERCAQNEIDDYQSYDKALNALREALKYLGKADGMDYDVHAMRMSQLETRIKLIEKFVQVRELGEVDGDRMMAQAETLLNAPDVENALQIGDVYGVMIEYLASPQCEKFDEAYEKMKAMRERIPNVNIAYYVNMQTIEKIHTACNIPLGRGRGAEEELFTDEAVDDGIDERLVDDDVRDA